MRYTKGSAGSDLKAERQWWSWVKLNYNLWPLANKNPVLLTSSIASACPVPLAMSMGVFPSLFSDKKCKQYGVFRQIWKVETKTSKRTIAIKPQLRTNQIANTCASLPWARARKHGMLPLAGKVGLELSAGKKVWCGAREKMKPLPPLREGVKDRQKGIGREHLAGSTC